MGKRIFFKKYILSAFLLLLFLSLHSITYGFPYWSRAETSRAFYEQDKNPYHDYDYESGPTESFAITVFPSGTYYDGIALGWAKAYANPMTSTLKHYSWGSYLASNVISWPLCWGGYCWPYAPGELGLGGGRAYARSVWEVKSDFLTPGTPVSLELSISLDGEIYGDPINDGKVDLRMHAWLSTPEIVSNYLLGFSPQGVMNSLYKDTYPAVYGWWEDVGYSPALSIYATNYSQGPFSERVSRVFGSDDSCGGLPCPYPPSPLSQIHVGDILILELELWGGVLLKNDGSPTLSPVKADFFNTGLAGFNIMTEGVYLSPAVAPIPLPSTLILLATGSGIIALYRKIRKKDN